MIYTKRGTTPTALSTPGSIGHRETTRVITFYADPKNVNKAFHTYAAYKDDTVVEALTQIFHGKCAYCESRYTHVHPVDVEHYRPKGGVVAGNQLKTPGYYWLAADWDNLLPSCIDCNRRRVQEIAGMPDSLLGKANLFPLRNEANRATNPGDEIHEEPLLINPCVDDPAQHLKFNENGIVKGLTDKGRASIEVLGLHRKSLTEARRDRSIEIRGTISTVKRLLRRIERKRNEGREYRESLIDLREEVKKLKAYLGMKTEYTALAGTLVNPILDRIFLVTGRRP
jgi:uncharacterized protein (TIGR02646 family)